MDIPRLGITLAGIRAFIASLPTPLDGKTTTEVCPFVKAATLASQRSFVEDRAAEGGACVGDATAFVSHAWAYLFLDVVAAMEAWEAKRAAPSAGGGGGGGPTFFWFDVFSNPQHGAIARPFEWWQTTFKDNVRRIGHTLLVLAWEDPKPLKRAWCLVEIVATLEAGAGFEVVMAPREEAQFVEALRRNFKSITQKTCTVDVAKAVAYHGAECLVGGVCRDVASGAIAACPGDLQRIMEAVARGVGFQEANKRVIGEMKEARGVRCKFHRDSKRRRADGQGHRQGRKGGRTWRASWCGAKLGLPCARSWAPPWAAPARATAQTWAPWWDPAR